MVIPRFETASIPTLVLLLALGAAPIGCAQPEEDGAREEEVSEADLARLKSLGYVNWVPVESSRRARSGVVDSDPQRYQDGYTLYNSRPRTEAHLLDMGGEVLHSWSSEESGAAKAAVDERLGELAPEMYGGWNHVVMYPSGELLVVGANHMLLKLSWQSETLWKLDIAAHHDVTVGGDGEIYALVNRMTRVRYQGGEVPLLDNEVLRISPAGAVQERISLVHALRALPELRSAIDAQIEQYTWPFHARDIESRLKSEGASRRQIRSYVGTYKKMFADRSDEPEEIKIAMLVGSPADPLHGNTVGCLDAHPAGLWQEKDLIVCFRKIDVVAVLSAESGAVVWHWGPGELEGPHHPTMLPNGNLLIFDNGTRRHYSRVIEVDPSTGEIVWSYQADPPESFLTMTRGGSQKLPNGNVLITETNRGRGFEVDLGGAIVWDFYNPEFVEQAAQGDRPAEQMRAAIYRMTRIDRAIGDALLAERAG